MSKLIDRFLTTVPFDTQSDENSLSFPSTEKQLALARELVRELLVSDSPMHRSMPTGTSPRRCLRTARIPMLYPSSASSRTWIPLLMHRAWA